jgi:hypothetical protein
MYKHTKENGGTFRINHYARQVPRCVESRCHSPSGRNALVRGLPPSMCIQRLQRILESNGGNARGRQLSENLAADVAGGSDDEGTIHAGPSYRRRSNEIKGVKGAMLGMLHLTAGAACCQLPDESTARVFQHRPCT